RSWASTLTQCATGRKPFRYCPLSCLHVHWELCWLRKVETSTLIRRGMDEEAPLRFYGCGINSFFQLGPLVSECPSQSAGAAAQASDDGSGAIIQGQNIHFSSQEKKSVLHLPQPLALERYVAEEDGLVQDIACGATFTIALTSRGVPYQWGTVNGRAYPEPSRVSLGVPLRCLQVSCGRKHALALMEGGFVTSWGVGYFGQLGQGDNLSSDRPRLIHHLDPPRLGGDRVVAVACGGQHSAVHTAGQSVFCFGFNRYGQVGQGQACNKISTPRPVNMSGIGSSQIRQLVCGRHHTSVLTDKGQVFSWGASSFGRLGLPDPKKIVGLPTEVPAFRCCPLAALACGDFHVLGLGVDGRAYAWGYGSEGQGGLGATLHLRTPRPVEGLEGSRIAQIACGAWWSMVVTEAGRLYTWGYGDGGWLGLERASKLPYVEPCPPVTKYGATCSFDSDFNACLPAVVSTLSHLRVEKVVAGGGHTIIMARRIQRRLCKDLMDMKSGKGGRGSRTAGQGEGKTCRTP
ncbi:hect domain and rld 4, partial [Nannochloropsis gaditana CCMP526]|uniref:hect domain and rld 4 n=1 Tax=Nannochloropsis gaditana (strain CCMP526) TaxID=1093141 RepID=UPI00029F61D6